MRLLLILAYLTSEGVLSGYITLPLSTDDIFDIMEVIDWREKEGEREEGREKEREREGEREGDRDKERQRERDRETEREIRIPNITSDPLPPQWKQ